METTERAYAVVDIGTNSVHLLLADFDTNGELHPIIDIKYPIRLGTDISLSKQISTKSVEELLKALEAVKQLAKIHSAKILCVATYAMRTAKNNKRVLAEILQKTGLRVDLVSGLEEAKLMYLGQQLYFDLTKQNTLAVDIGGGSTELVYCPKGGAPIFTSIPIGAVMLHQKYFQDNDVKKSLSKSERFIMSLLDQLNLPDQKISLALGSSGTIKAACKLDYDLNSNKLDQNKKSSILEDKLHGHRLAVDSVYALHDELVRLKTPDKIKSSLPISSRRAEVFLAGMTIFRLITEYFDLDCWTYSTASLREGVILKSMKQSS